MRKINDKIKSIGFAISGGVFCFMALMLMIIGIAVSSVDQDGDNIIIIIFSIIGGVYLIAGTVMFCVFAAVRRRMKMIATYQHLLAGKKSATLEGISKTLGIPQMKVVQNLQFLMSHGYFEYGYIDYEYGIFFLASDRLEFDRLKRSHVYKCKSCGANTLIIDGDPMVCSYCGSSLV